MDHPRTREVLKRFPRSQLIPIDDYQNVFGRSRQDFWRQKASPKLVLAHKKENLLYKGNVFLQGNESPNFCYTAQVLNCPYDCHYCYLQGMYAGANIVAFVNLEDTFRAAEEACATRPDPKRPLHLAISYDTDLLALEGILGFGRDWLRWAESQPDMLVEIRTKSAIHRLLAEFPPVDTVRLAWTLSPDPVARQYEEGAPSLDARIKALKHAADKGWRISICLDPVLMVPGHHRVYSEFVHKLERELPWPQVEQVELGVFRMSSTHFKRMQKRPGTDLLHYPFEHANNAVSYKLEERKELVSEVFVQLQNSISEEKIHLWI
ncbi:MAG: radical SAM protein [Puniceicoccaceae bacterium]